MSDSNRRPMNYKSDALSTLGVIFGPLKIEMYKFSDLLQIFESETLPTYLVEF